MKKISIFMAIAAAASLASCTAQAPKANLKSDLDSLSYSIGMAQTQGLKGYLTGRLNVDTAYMAEFIKGLNDGVSKTSKKDIAYMAGIQIGQQISGENGMIKNINQELFAGDSTKTISKDNFMAGFIAGTLEKGGVMSMEAAQAYTRTAMEAIKTKALEEKYADYKAENEKFLADNKAKEGVKTTPSGLQYKVITEGKGEIPADTCKVKVNYKGTLIDGTEFDSSYKRNEPATFRANQVIKGWTEALTMMPVGSKWELYIPQDLAYGARESGGQIKPFSTLNLEVQLLSISPFGILAQIIPAILAGPLNPDNIFISCRHDTSVGTTMFGDIHIIVGIIPVHRIVRPSPVVLNTGTQSLQERYFICSLYGKCRIQALIITISVITQYTGTHIADPTVINQFSAIGKYRLLRLPNTQFTIRIVCPIRTVTGNTTDLVIG